MATKASSSSVDIPQLCKVDFYKLLGLQRPGKKPKVVKPGPNGFVVEVTSDGERETDEPNLVFLNRGELAQFQKDKEAAQAEAKELAKEKKKAKAKERAAKKKNAKSLDPPKAEQSKSKKIETPGPAQHEPGQSAQGSAMPHYRDVRVTTAKTGVVRSYLTGLDISGKRVLITELTEKNNGQHIELMTKLKSLIQEGNWAKAQAVAWRDDQKSKSSTA